MLHHSEGVPSALASCSTQELLGELLHRAELRIKEKQYTKALRFINAVLGYAPNDGRLLQWASEIAVHQANWALAGAYAQRALSETLAPEIFVRACTVACGAVTKTDGPDAATAVFNTHKAKLREVLDLPGIANIESLNMAVSCAMAAGDMDFARTYFQKRFPEVEDGVGIRLSPFMATKDWCARTGAAFRVLEPPRRVSSAGLPKQSRSWDYLTKGVNLAVIPKGEFLSGLDFVVTEDGTFLDDSGHMSSSQGTAWFPRVHDWIIEKILHVWPEEVTTHDVDALFLSCSQGLHMGHWQCDFLPRLRALQYVPDLMIATCTELTDKHRDLIRAFGIDDARIINCDLNKRYRFRNLVVVQTGVAATPEPNNVCFLTDALRWKPAPATRVRRIFLERGKKTRAITNREAFDVLLDAYGFERLCLADLSIPEQRKALSEADVVVTTYGSELLCTFMMSENSHLIELNWDPTELNAGAAPMSSMVGIKYHLVYCPPAETTRHRILKKDRDFSVDLRVLSAVLHAIGVTERPSAMT